MHPKFVEEAKLRGGKGNPKFSLMSSNMMILTWISNSKASDDEMTRDR